MRALVFPGQGSQFVGMGKDLIDLSPQSRDKFEFADKLYEGRLLPTMFDGPEEALRQTYFTQPAVFLYSAVLTDVLQERGIAYSFVAGHSLGEYSSLYAAGALDFPALLYLIKLRSTLMQHAGEQQPGAMAAVIGLDREIVLKLCAESQHVVVVANDNAPDQVVISGEPQGVAQVGEKCKQAGAKRVLPLNVSGAFHSPLLEQVARDLELAIEQASWRDAKVPVVMNLSAQPRMRAEDIRADLVKQLISPVRWVETVRLLLNQGVSEFVEVGPGKVLAGLIRRIAREAQVVNVGTRAELEDFLAKNS